MADSAPRGDRFRRTGHGRAAARPAARARTRRAWLTERIPLQLPITVVLVIAGLGFARVIAEHWREGTSLLAGALLVAGVARILLPEDRAGLLAVRSQAVDVLCYAGFGVFMLFLAVTIPRTPFILQ